MVRYNDWQGNAKQKCKRGFATKREAVQWEREFLRKEQSNVDMTFESFYECYRNDLKSKLKENTWMSKESIIEKKILPYFGKKQLCDIKARDVIAWQNEIRELKDPDGKKLSPAYLKSIHAQLSAMFNHAVRYYDLPENPALKAGGMGDENSSEMDFWTQEEYLRFADAMMDKPMSYYAFELLYWCGIREGELLALTREDFNLDRRELRINKSYQRLKGKDVITTPKTKESNRVIKLPDFLCDEMKDFFSLFYSMKPGDRLFQFTKHYLYREMVRGCKATGVKKIRVHDLRHSHVSLLINNGFSAFEIAKRVGHRTERITYRYAHLFPSVQDAMVEKLDLVRGLSDTEKRKEGDNIVA